MFCNGKEIWFIFQAEYLKKAYFSSLAELRIIFTACRLLVKHDTSLLLLDIQSQTYAWLCRLPTDIFLSDTVVSQKDISFADKSFWRLRGPFRPQQSIALLGWRLVRWLETLSYNGRLKGLWLFTLEKRWLQGDIIAAFQDLKGTYKKEWLFF